MPSSVGLLFALAAGAVVFVGCGGDGSGKLSGTLAPDPIFFDDFTAARPA